MCAGDQAGELDVNIERNRHEKHPQPGIPLHAQRENGHSQDLRAYPQAACRAGSRAQGEGGANPQVGDWAVALGAIVAAILIATSELLGWPMP